MAEPRIQYAKTSDGVNIAFWTMGEGPSALVLMPPTPYVGSLVGWRVSKLRHYFELLATDRMTVRFDHRGFGDSDRVATDFSIEARMLDLEGVADSLGLRRFALLGMNQAGPVAIAFSARHPERVSRLILFGASARGEDFFRSDQNRALWQLAAADWHLFTELQAFMFLGWSAGEEGGRYAAAHRESATFEAARASRDATVSFDVTDLLAEVRSPTLVVHHRAVRDVEEARRLAAGILNARLSVLEEGVIENPEETAKTVLAFLNEGTAASVPAQELQAASVVTILFTDLASSAALTRRLGDAGLHEVRRTHNEIVRNALNAKAGTEIKHTGDGIMASFPSANNALECAIAVQRGVAERNDDNLLVHIGLNAGEPIADERDLFGTSVDLASRICDQASGGEILVSDVVRQLAAGKDFLFSDRGVADLKGFDEPVRVFEVLWREDE